MVGGRCHARYHCSINCLYKLDDANMKFAKGYTASAGALLITVSQYANDFCGSVWPSLLAVLTTLGVVLVPNKKAE
jgi:hypothetical protein